MSELRVMTFNIHGARPRVGTADVDAVAAVIREQQVDLAGLQEVHRYMPPPYVFQNQPGLLRQKLGLEVTFLPSLGLGPVGYGNAILSGEPPTTVRRIRLPGGGEPRALLDAQVRVRGRTLHFLVTHLGLPDDQRRKQVHAIAARLAQYDGPVILTGDLNAVPDSPEIRALEAAGLKVCGEGLHTFPCDDPACRLDYVMVSRHFRLLDCRAVPTRVSDHLPVVAEVELV